MQFMDEEAPVLHTDLKLSKNKYELLRKRLEEKNVDVLPPHKKIANGKTKYYPPSLTIEIKQTGTTLQLQKLLNHTAERVLKIKDVPPDYVKNLK